MTKKRFFHHKRPSTVLLDKRKSISQKLLNFVSKSVVVQVGNPRGLNHMLLSEMRKAEKRTRIRVEWASGNIIEKFFDQVPKGTLKLNEKHSCRGSTLVYLWIIQVLKSMKPAPGLVSASWRSVDD